nr:unnamed protein product [Digitaria exilis]
MARAARKAAAAALLSPPLSSSSPSSAALQPRAGRYLLGRNTGAASSGAPQERASGCGQPCLVGARGFHDARRAFDGTSTRSLPAWTAIISGCARGGRHADGMRAFAEMLGDGGAPAPNAFVLAGVLRCCAGLGDVEPGRRVHGWMLRRGVRQDVVLCNAVLDMYAKCGHHDRARRAFWAMADKDAVSWNIVLSACLQGGDVLGAVRLFDESPLRDTTSWNTIISGLHAVVVGLGTAAPWSCGDGCAGG